MKTVSTNHVPSGLLVDINRIVEYTIASRNEIRTLEKRVEPDEDWDLLKDILDENDLREVQEQVNRERGVTQTEATNVEIDQDVHNTIDRGNRIPLRDSAEYRSVIRNKQAGTRPETNFDTPEGFYSRTGFWMEFARVYDELSVYPREDDVDKILAQAEEGFFLQFREHQQPLVASRVYQFRHDKWTLRIGWYNPRSLAFPTGFSSADESIPENAIYEPDRYFVYRDPMVGWAQDRTLIPPPSLPGPARRGYSYLYRPTLLHFMETYMLGRDLSKSKSSPTGFGGMFMSEDNRFGFGYRLYVTEDGIPMDHRARRRNEDFRNPTRDFASMHKLQSIVYGDSGIIRSRRQRLVADNAGKGPPNHAKTNHKDTRSEEVEPLHKRPTRGRIDYYILSKIEEVEERQRRRQRDRSLPGPQQEESTATQQSAPHTASFNDT
ncbi:MAG: hypothetical protein M1831_005550 [Alyxoria varia]|nr:MAG: hypothetical protein M1831_005550 [Alyxoria varia]